MKAVSAEYSFDGSRLVVPFTSEGRVDLRDGARSVQTLNAHRNEADRCARSGKSAGWVGKRGKQLCCSSWLREFNPVTIKMAKTQNLPLNLLRYRAFVDGCFGCLPMSRKSHEDGRKKLPKVGAVVKTPEGEGRYAG